jgi:ribosomal protein L11 methyltransferase
VNTNPKNCEQHAQLLSDLGALSVTFDIQDHEIEQELAPEALDFSHVHQLTGIFHEIHERDHDTLSKIFGTINQEILPEKTWELEWLQYFQPQCIDPVLGFWVGPPMNPLPSEAKIYLNIQPGLAFGTGTHPTTLLCLSALARYQERLKTPNSTLVDFGCGSGILSIAACLLGASTVYGVDHDPQAVLSTAQNRDLNQINPETLLITKSDHIPPHSADIVIANILKQPLISLAPLLNSFLKPGGLLLLSGILKHQTQDLMAAYPEILFSAPVSHGDWILLAGRLRQDPKT